MINLLKYFILTILISIGTYYYSIDNNIFNNILNNFIITSIDPTINNCLNGDSSCNNDNIPKGATVDGRAPIVIKECIDRYEKECPLFASKGDCTNFPGWMTVYCPKSCNNCHLRDPKVRCSHEALNTTTNPAFQYGELTNMFNGLTSRFREKYNVQIHLKDPFIATFDNFINDQEIEALINSIRKWERSTDQGQMNEYGEQGRLLSTGRTSSNGWCDFDCDKNPLVQGVYQRIEDITLVPKTNYESFQVLKYEKGQQYNVHHDMSEEDNKLICGPRILTFFIYLSDVEEGGETEFPSLNIKIKPKKGKALLWPSVLDNELLVTNDGILHYQQDGRTIHAARPVIKGVKYAANAWIHSHDYMIANRWGCTGTFDEL